MGQRLRVFVAFAGDLGLVPSSHMVVSNVYKSSPKGSDATDIPQGLYIHRYLQAKHP